MFDPFQALAVFADVHVPEADVPSLRARAVELREYAKRIDAIAHAAETRIADVLKLNDSRSVDRFAHVWADDLAPRYTAIRGGLTELAAGCDEYADEVEMHRQELLIIGTQIAAMVFTLVFGYLYPGAKVAGEAVLKWLVARAKLEKTIFQKVTKAVLEARIGRFNVGTYALREGLDATADAVVWTAVKTGVHSFSSWATGRPIGNPLEYAGKHFAAELAYNGGIKAMRDVRMFLPASKFTETLLGNGNTGKFFRRTVAASTLYAMVASGEMTWQGSLRSAMAHAPRAFILHR